METRVKERLVGAAVLVAVAFILIPEMLSGPHPQEPPAATPADGALRSFSIDLNKSASHSSANAPASADTNQPLPNPADQVPPPEMPAATIAPAANQAIAGSTPNSTESASTVEPDSSETPPPAKKSPAASRAPIVEPPAKAASSPAASAKPIEPERPASTAPERAGGNHQWAVQVGSFGNDATAQKVAQDFKQKGYPAFVMAFKKDGKTLYRVRVGPQSQRAAADAVAARLKAEGVTNLAVVAHP